MLDMLVPHRHERITVHEVCASAHVYVHNVLQGLMITLEEQCEVNPALHSAAASVLYTFGCSVTGSPDSARPLTLLSGVTS